MYDYISGKIEELSPTAVVLETAGVGYYINISLQSFEKLERADSAKIFVHQYMIRDELPVTYGFISKSERELFRMLVNVSGVGGNTARMVLSTYTIAELRQIISGGDSIALKKVKGLGAKTAEKIIVELRDKVISVDVPDGDTTESGQYSTSATSISNNEVFSEAMAALMMLGFNKAASEKALKTIIQKNSDARVEDVIRMALKSL